MNVRNKGNRGEREWAEYLREYGVSARRVPLSGAMSGWKGDVVSRLGNDFVTWQVKRRKKVPVWLSDDFVAFREDRGKWRVVLPAEYFIKLVLE